MNHIEEAERQYVENKGREQLNQCWILSDRDVWYRNPFYTGPVEPHPEEVSDDDPEEWFDDRDDFDRDFDDDGGRYMFADPGGRSALRAASESDPRDLPCPTCERPNMLTRADRSLGYQCDICADRAERWLDY